jgi:hypothetical protein
MFRPLIISCLLVAGGLAQAAAPVVTHVLAAQRTGTKLVDITYDVAADTGTVTITLEISADGGAGWLVPATTVTGDIGAGIATGTGRTITWNAGSDWNGQTSSQMRFRVTAEVVQTPPAGFSLIPAGTFQMGDPSSPRVGSSDELPPHSVSVSAFFMAQQEVTKTLWDTVRTWGSSNGYPNTDLPGGHDGHHRAAGDQLQQGRGTSGRPDQLVCDAEVVQRAEPDGRTHALLLYQRDEDPG